MEGGEKKNRGETRKREIPDVENNFESFQDNHDIKLKEDKIALSRLPSETKLATTAAELERKKKEAVRNIKYLLKKSMQFSTFFKKTLEQHLDQKKSGYLDQSIDTVLNDENQEQSFSIESVDVLKQLKFFEGGTLKPYQIEGLTWMTVLFENGVNGILADEMGLGKTVQIIALISHLYERHIEGPFLIVAPLSTIPNWKSEFLRFSPKIPVVVYYGSLEQRLVAREEVNAKYRLDGNLVNPVVITTYQIPLMETGFLSTFVWQYLIVDEGHRLKNHNSKLSQNLRMLRSTNKLLLTGTPLQNNMTELWALLNFILPTLFTDLEMFSSLLLIEDVQNESKVSESTNVISTLHEVLAPFMLRRMKSEVLADLVPKKETLVYCPLTKLQRDLYMNIIDKNIAKLKQPGASEVEDDEELYGFQPKRRKCTLNINNYVEPELDDFENTFKINVDENEVSRKPFITRLTMQHPMSMFKKVVDHPYLVHFPLKPNSDEKELLVDEQLVSQSGKMLVLDAMLAKLKKNHHKIIIFSTLTMTLDLIEEFLIMRNHEYRRLDGSCRLKSREEAIDQFNMDPNVFIFLISTRAGGLGINLTSADTVIFFDRDWNPQADIQAQGRCHRIGQTKPVMVFTLVTKNTIDERIIKSAHAKRILEKFVIKDGKFKSLDKRLSDNIDFEELLRILHSSDNTEKIHSNGYVFTDEELDALLNREDLYKVMQENAICNHSS